MTDFLTPLKNAVVTRLQGQVGAPVFDHVPDEKQPPVVILDSLAKEAEDDKDGGLWRLTGTLQVVAQGRSRDPFRAIIAAAEGLLNGWRPTGPGVAFIGGICLLSSGEQTLGDGVTHLGDIQFQIFAQPA